MVPRWNTGYVSAIRNGAIVTIALLYGDGDILKTLEYAIRMGDDGDCNASSACAIVGVMLGYSGQPAAWRTDMEALATGNYDSTISWEVRYFLNQKGLNDLIARSFRLAEMGIKAGGGTVTADSVTIVIQEPLGPKYWEPWGEEPVLLDSDFVQARLFAQPYFAIDSATVNFDAKASIGIGPVYFWDFGDGTTSTLARPIHHYAAVDTYRVTLRVQGSRGADTAYANIYIGKRYDPTSYLKHIGTPIGSAYTGGRETTDNINVIRDNVYPVYSGPYSYGTGDDASHTEAWVGYTFSSQYCFTKVRCHYGFHFGNYEGVFIIPRIQVHKDSTWIDITSVLLADYNNTDGNATGFDSFTISFSPPVQGDGIRVIGKPSGGLVSCAELDVFDTSTYVLLTQRETASIPLEGITLSIAPNPFNPSVNIQVTGWKRGSELKILNVCGRVVANLTSVLNNGAIGTMPDRIAWNASGFASGIYLVMLKSGRTEMKQKIVLTR